MIDPEVQAAIDAEADTRAQHDQMEAQLRTLADSVERTQRQQGDAQILSVIPKLRFLVQGSCENVGSVFPNVVKYGDGTADPVMPFSGRVVALSVSLSSQFDIGGIAVHARGNGVRFEDDFLLVPLGQQYVYKNLVQTMTFQAGQRVGFDIVSIFDQPNTVDATLLMVVEAD